MNPPTVDPFTLPSLPLANRSELPNCPAIYFVLNGDAVLYIGRANNLYQRWAAHHRWNQLKIVTTLPLTLSGIAGASQIHFGDLLLHGVTNV